MQQQQQQQQEQEQHKSASTPTMANRDTMRQSCSDPASVKKPMPVVAPLKRRSTGTVKPHQQKHHEKEIWRAPGFCEIPNILGSAYLEPLWVDTTAPKKKAPEAPIRPPWIHARWKADWTPAPLAPVIKPEESAFVKRIKKAMPTLTIVDLPRTRYHGFQEIGTGVNGSVMQVRVSGQSKGIALKRCKLDQDREYRAAVVRELLIMASGHANIIKLGEASVYKNEVWMGMDLMQSSVFAVLCACALPEEYAIFIARQTLNALAFLHSKGFFHRDVKCENLLIGYNGEVKLADFGLAASKRRQNHDRLGTAKWMAPEVITEDPYDEKVDLWSLGITIIEMMDRVPPHYAVKNDEEVFDLVLASPSPSFTYSQPTIYCTGLVAWLLEMNPENRPTAKDVIAEIDLHIEQNLLKTADASSLVTFASKTLA